MHRIFSGDGWLIRTRSLPESASPAALCNRCSIYSPSRWICPVVAGKREFPKGDPLSEKSPAGYSPHSPSGRHPRERGRPARMLSLRLPLSFPATCCKPTALPAGRGPAEAEAGRRCRLIPVEEMAEAAGGFVRAGRPRSRVGFLPTGSHQRDKRAEAFWRQLSLKEVHQSWCLFVFIGGSSSLTNGCFPSE